MAIEEVFSFENPVFAGFAFYATVVLLKLMLTAGTFIPLHRVLGHVYLTKEDVRCFTPPGVKPNSRMGERIELLRRIVANDLENIPTFIFLGAFYVASLPSVGLALWHFRLFALGRILHTTVYYLNLQPHRVLCFTLAYLVNMAMAVQILLATL